MDSGITDRPKRRPESGAEVEYALDPEDYVACYLFLREKAGQEVRPVVVAPVGWRPWVFLYAAAGLLLAAFFLWRSRAPDGLIVMDLLSAVGLGFLTVTLWPHGPQQVPRNPRREVQEELERRYDLGLLRMGRRDQVWMDDEGFTEVNECRDEDNGVTVVERKETRVRWPAVAAIDVAEEHAVFAVLHKGYLFVPKRAFADESAFHHFVERARTLRQKLLTRADTGVTLGPTPSHGLQLPR